MQFASPTLAMPEYPIGTCENCEEAGRLLKYARRTMCCKYGCQQAAHALVVARKAAAHGDAGGEGQPKKVPPVFCFKIISVHGQQDVDPARLVGAKRRNKLANSDMEVSYLIYGEFGEDERDTGFKDTRWVELTDLLNLSHTEQKKLVAYERKLEQRMTVRKQKLVDAEADERA